MELLLGETGRGLAHQSIHGAVHPEGVIKTCCVRCNTMSYDIEVRIKRARGRRVALGGLHMKRFLY
jgi:hypothetical protein